MRTKKRGEKTIAWLEVCAITIWSKGEPVDLREYEGRLHQEDADNDDNNDDDVDDNVHDDVDANVDDDDIMKLLSS